MSTMEDRIKRALANKPTNINQVQAKNNNGKREVRQSLRRPRPQPPTPVGGFPPAEPNDCRKNAIARMLSQTPQKPQLSNKSITSGTLFVTSNILGYSGYDNIVYEVVRGLLSLGVDTRINSKCQINDKVVPKNWPQLLTMRPANNWELIIIPPCSLEAWSPGNRSVVFTMWETDYLSPEWVRNLNRAAFVVAPSQWNIDSFKNCGVKVPIYKVPLGYNPLYYNKEDSFPSECVFGTAAALNAGGIRKDINKVVGAFSKAFPNENVKLKIKLTPHCKFDLPIDARIELIKDYLSPLELANWYRSLTAFINTSHAEAWGLHLTENMACGRPIISPKYSGVTEYFDEEVGYVVDHEIVPAFGSGLAPYSGHWAEAKEDSLIEKMKEVYNNRNVAKEKGEMAALRASNYYWKLMGQKLFKLLKENKVI